MMLRNKCSAWLGLAGACLFAIGCGSDVPDPGSDAKAADGNTPAGGGGGRQQAVAAAEAPNPEAAAPAQAQPPAQGQGGNATNEMLAMSGGQATPPAGGATPPAGGATPPPAATPPSAPPPASGGNRGRPNAPGAAGGGGPPAGGVPGAGGPGGAPSGGMADMMKKQQDMQKQMQGQMQQNMGGIGAGGKTGAGAVAAGANKVAEGPADVSSPHGAVRTFLEALKARDGDRLSEATARRAVTEAVEKNRDLFTKILEISLSDSDFDDLAKKLEGYQVAFENPAKSTGKIDVVIQKTDGSGSRFTRKVTARREKKGWGVLDIGPTTEFKGSGARRVSKSR